MGAFRLGQRCRRLVIRAGHSARGGDTGERRDAGDVSDRGEGADEHVTARRPGDVGGDSPDTGTFGPERP